MDRNLNIENDNNFPVDGSRIKVFTADVSEVIKEEAVIEIIQKIKSSFPFTFIEKSNIQKLVNKLSGFFWVKEPSGKYIIANERFAKAVGVRTSQLENKLEAEFVPPFQKNMFSIMNSYILDTSNSVILEGISSSIFTNLANNEQIIQFPLLDVDNKVVAIIGVSSIKREEAVKEKVVEAPQLFSIGHFREPVVLVDAAGKILDFTGGFAEVLNISSSFRGKMISELFDSKFYSKFVEFIQKLDESEQHPLTIETNNNKIKTSLEFIKVFDSSGVLQFVQITFPPAVNQSQTEIKSTMYDLIMQTSPDAIFIYDIDNLKFLEVNDAAVKMYGYKRNELLNMDLTDLYAPEDIQTLIESSDSKNMAGTFTGPWRHKRKDGSSMMVEISKASLEYKGKRAHINIVRDITDKLENSKRIQYYQAAFEHSGDMILFTDVDGFITSVNDQVTRILGFSKKDLEKRPFLSLAVDADRARVNKEIFHSGSKSAVSLELTLKNYSNEPIHTDVFAKPIVNFKGDIDSFIIVVKTASQFLPSVSGSAQAAIDSSFLSNVFHEILTPINVILGFTQELFESINSPNSEQKEVSEIIKENQKVLLQIMDNAVEYTSLEQNSIRIKTENIRFTEIIDDLKENVRKSADDKNISLEYGKISSSLEFESDQQRFVSLLTLLLKFSINLTKEKSIFLSAYGNDRNSFIVSIRDQRSSISPVLLKGLQEVFTEDENAVRKHLGFSRFSIRLVQKLIQILGARIEVIKKAGQPIEYALVFPNILEADNSGLQTETEEIEISAPKPEVKSKPVSAEPKRKPEEEEDYIEKEPAPKKKPEPAKSEEKHKLDLSALSCFYLEDQVDSQILFKSQMKEMKKIDFAESFEKALPFLKSNKYDFIVLDINLQGEYNGLDAMRIIQKMPGYEKTPIIACTAYLLPGARENFIAAGFKDFVSKPVMKDKLTEILKKIFV